MDEPLLVVGDDTDWWAATSWRRDPMLRAVATAFPVGVGMVVGIDAFLSVAKTVDLPVAGTVPTVSAALVFGVLVACIFVGYLGTRPRRAKRARVAFFDGIVVVENVDVLGLITGGRSRRLLRWPRIRCFRDDRAEFVELVKVGQYAVVDPYDVPTLTPADRQAVLELLEAREVPRRD